jgi:hypothetical protein
MDNYDIKHEPGTSFGSAIVIAASLIGTLMMRPDVGQTSQRDISLLLSSPVKIEESSSTFGQYTNSFTGEYETPILSFEENVASFYAQLLTMQEPLGREFEEVLYDNLWDLLVRI